MSVTLDPMGNLYVADRFNHRIQFFLTSDITIASVNGQFGNDSNTFNSPYTKWL